MYGSFVIKELKKLKIYIYGKGRRGIRIFSLLEKYEIFPFAFIDSDPAKREGDKKVPCVSIDEVEDGDDVRVIISPLDKESIIHLVEDHGLKWWDGGELLSLQYLFPDRFGEEDFKCVKPFNYYDSPYADCRFLHEYYDNYIKKECYGIDFNVERQFQLINVWKEQYLPIYKWTLNEDDSTDRYNYNNSWFKKGSADVLHLMMRTLKPKHIIEVGSGYSTAVMLDTNEKYFDNTIEIKCIEPNADRLNSILKKDDNLSIKECDLQQVDLSYFDCLEANDILFIDSSHVAKIGSDVNYYLFEILPRIQRGVYIHIHDIFYPMEYSEEWMLHQGRAYNEMYIVRAFLMYNEQYKIQFFGELLMNEYPEMIPNELDDLSGSLWIRKENK